MTEDEAKRELLKLKKGELVEAISSIYSATDFIDLLELRKMKELKAKDEEARKALDEADKEYQDYLSETAKRHGAPKEDFSIVATSEEHREAERLHDKAEEAYRNWAKARKMRVLNSEKMFLKLVKTLDEACKRIKDGSTPYVVDCNQDEY